MAGYHIDIYVREDGYPEWQHHEQEWHLTQPQQDTLRDLHTAYKSLQHAIATIQHIIDSNAAMRAVHPHTFSSNREDWP